MERKYALTRLAAGDYLLPSNDARTIWRIRRYVDGPSQGLDVPRDRDFWGVWRFNGPVDENTQVDPDDTDSWDMWSSALDTRADAIDEALRQEA